MKNWFVLFTAALVLQSGAFAANTEKDVLAAMDAYKSAMLKRDAMALDKIFHKDLSYSHSNGKLETKAEAIAAATTGTTVTEIMDFTDSKVRIYGNTALVRGDVRVKSNTNDLKLSVLHVWTKSPQGWQMVARQSTRYVAP